MSLVKIRMKRSRRYTKFDPDLSDMGIHCNRSRIIEPANHERR